MSADTSKITPGALPFAYGEGDAVIFLVHGLGGTPHDFRSFGRIMSQKGYRIQALLLPGHGRGEKALAGTSIYEMKRHIAESINSCPARDKYALGVSFGAVMLCDLLAARLINVRGAVIVNPSFYDRFSDFWPRRLLNIWSVFSPFFPKPGLTAKDREAYKETGSLVSWPINLLRQCSDYAHKQVLPKIKNIPIRVLLLKNARDKYINSKKSGKQWWDSASQNFIHEEIPGNTHRPFRNEEMIGFIAERVDQYIKSDLSEMS